jgi:tRNA(adenine34) deaminase
MSEFEAKNVFMSRAIDLAQVAGASGEVPVGAVVVRDNKIIGEGFNQPILASDPTAHAEIIAMRNASKNIDNYRLTGCDLYVTLEPCLMCFGAMINARISNLFFGAAEPKSGIVTNKVLAKTGINLNHKIACEGGFLQDKCVFMMQEFFHKKREQARCV